MSQYDTQIVLYVIGLTLHFNFKQINVILKFCALFFILVVEN